MTQKKAIYLTIIAVCARKKFFLIIYVYLSNQLQFQIIIIACFFVQYLYACMYNSKHHAKLIIHAVESLGQQITAPWSTLLLALLFYDTIFEVLIASVAMFLPRKTN